MVSLVEYHQKGYQFIHSNQLIGKAVDQSNWLEETFVETYFLKGVVHIHLYRTFVIYQNSFYR